MSATLKAIARLIFKLLFLPAALLSGFGRQREIYTLFAHMCALVPGFIGVYARAAFYAMTLAECSQEIRMGLGAFFVHPDATVAANVSIGGYSIVGRVRIGERTLIASGVQILSGSQQHTRNEDGSLGAGEFAHVNIGSRCWIGAGAIVMADVGDGATVAAGSVVYSPVAAGATVAGNPARVVRMGSGAKAQST